MNKEPIRLLLVDDHPAVREGIKGQLASYPQIVIVGEAEDGQEAVRQTLALTPDIVLMDISMPGMNGLVAARILQEQAPEVKVVLMTMYDNTEYIVEAAHIGARGYLPKDSPKKEIVSALEAVDQGILFFPPEIAQTISQTGHMPHGQDYKPQLTRREQQVLASIVQEKSNKEIAVSLHVSIATVEVHRQHIMAKLDINTAEGLKKYAIAKGMASEEE